MWPDGTNPTVLLYDCIPTISAKQQSKEDRLNLNLAQDNVVVLVTMCPRLRNMNF
jgi:hypothetical protein